MGGVRNRIAGSFICVGVYILYCVHLINIVLFKASSYEFNDSVFICHEIMVNLLAFTAPTVGSISGYFSGLNLERLNLAAIMHEASFLWVYEYGLQVG